MSGIEREISVTVSEPGRAWLKLTQRCETCEGRGRRPDYLTDTIVPCAICRGRGMLLTLGGADVVRFLEEQGFQRVDGS